MSPVYPVLSDTLLNHSELHPVYLTVLIKLYYNNTNCPSRPPYQEDGLRCCEAPPDERALLNQLCSVLKDYEGLEEIDKMLGIPTLAGQVRPSKPLLGALLKKYCEKVIIVRFSEKVLIFWFCEKVRIEILRKSEFGDLEKKG